MQARRQGCCGACGICRRHKGDRDVKMVSKNRSNDAVSKAYDLLQIPLSNNLEVLTDPKFTHRFCRRILFSIIDNGIDEVSKFNLRAYKRVAVCDGQRFILYRFGVDQSLTLPAASPLDDGK